jgi:hypothetical protein
MKPTMSQQPHNFDNFATAPAVKSTQGRYGSRRSNARLESPSIRSQIGPKEAALITARDFLHLATIGENGWPYTQYRRGFKGFLRILDSTTLALADFPGDRQRMTCSVLLFLMDYSSQGCLKIWATTESSDDPRVIGQFTDWSPGATIDRAFLFHVLAFEWNFQTNIAPLRTKESPANGLITSGNGNKTSLAIERPPFKERAVRASYEARPKYRGSAVANVPFEILS